MTREGVCQTCGLAVVWVWYLGVWDHRSKPTYLHRVVVRPSKGRAS